MRQLVSFLDKIRVRGITKEYYQMKFHASLHRAEIAPLEEILGVPSKEKQFDKETDEALNQRALQILKERKAMRNV